MVNHPLQIIFLFILPVGLLYFGLIPFEFRLLVLSIFSLFVLFSFYLEKISWRNLGIRWDNIRSSYHFYLFFTILGLITIIFTGDLLDRSFFIDQQWFIYLFSLVIPVSIAQELLFRGYLIYKLKNIYTNRYLVIFINGLLFTLIHLIYPEWQLFWPVIFTGGLGFAAVYYDHPNLFLASLAHLILNLAATGYGFFPIFT